MPSKENERIIENLAISGGVAKGIYHVGVYAALEEAGVMKNVKRISATSVGALMALGPALGVQADEGLAFMLNDVKFPKFKDADVVDRTNYRPVCLKQDGILKATLNLIANSFLAPYLLGKTCISVFKHGGLFNGNYIENVVGRLIKKKLNKDSLTFLELHNLTLTDPKYKDLYICATNYTANRSTYFSYETTPHMSIAKAIHCSMALPGAFKRVKYDGNEYIDGALYNNLPITAFDDDRYLADHLHLTGHINARTLGVSLSSPDRTTHIRDNKPYSKLAGYQALLLWGGLNAQDEQQRCSVNPVRTLYINADGIDSFNFNITHTDINKAFESAKAETMTYIDTYIRGVKDPYSQSEALTDEHKKKRKHHISPANNS